MGEPKSYKVGEAPWETEKPPTFKVGEAPWEKEPESPGLVQSALNGIASVGNAIDSYSGAPTRAAISAAQNGNNPIPAFTGQFGGDPSKAPTGHDIALKAGLSDKHALAMTGAQQDALDKQNDITFAGPKPAHAPNKDLYAWSPAQVGGAAIDMAADPTLAIPAVGLLKKTELGAKAAEMVGETAGRYTAKAADALKSVAEKAAVNATGATGKQAANFADTAGRELLDRGIVKFGDSQAKIASRASAAVDEANRQIDEALMALDAKGVTIDGNKIKETVAKKIEALKTDPSKADIGKILSGELENISAAMEAKGSPNFSASEAEQVKRGYNRKAGNWADPEKSQAGKEMYQTFRGAVEDAATAAAPDTAKLFEEGKKSHGLLAPINEAAERRASTTAQHPAGGFLDVTSGIAGAAAGGPAGAIVAPLARRVIAPRLASSVAVTADKAADILRSIPEIAKLEVSEPAMFKALASKMAITDAPALAKVAEQPTKGPDKWAADGASKLIEHSPSDKQVIEKAKGASDQSTKELLIRASDLKPGSKAMENIMAKLRAKTASVD